MNKYDSIYILRPELKDDLNNKKQEIIDRLCNRMGKVERVEDLGLKRLAYNIKGNKEGIYIQINFRGTLEECNQVEKIAREIDEIIKFIVIRVND